MLALHLTPPQSISYNVRLTQRDELSSFGGGWGLIALSQPFILHYHPVFIQPFILFKIAHLFKGQFETTVALFELKNSD